jgi:hypothetical protein
VRPSRDQRIEDRVEAVPIAINRMPHRHQATCLGEQKKQHAIEHRERVLEEEVRLVAAPRPPAERLEQQAERVEDAGSQSPAHLDAVARG